MSLKRFFISFCLLFIFLTFSSSFANTQNSEDESSETEENSSKSKRKKKKSDKQDTIRENSLAAQLPRPERQIPSPNLVPVLNIASDRTPFLVLLPNLKRINELKSQEEIVLSEKKKAKTTEQRELQLNDVLINGIFQIITQYLSFRDVTSLLTTSQEMNRKWRLIEKVKFENKLMGRQVIQTLAARNPDLQKIVISFKDCFLIHEESRNEIAEEIIKKITEGHFPNLKSLIIKKNKKDDKVFLELIKAFEEGKLKNLSKLKFKISKRGLYFKLAADTKRMLLESIRANPMVNLRKLDIKSVLASDDSRQMESLARIFSNNLFPNLEDLRIEINTDFFPNLESSLGQLNLVSLDLKLSGSDCVERLEALFKTGALANLKKLSLELYGTKDKFNLLFVFLRSFKEMSYTKANNKSIIPEGLEYLKIESDNCNSEDDMRGLYLQLPVFLKLKHLEFFNFGLTENDLQSLANDIKNHNFPNLRTLKIRDEGLEGGDFDVFYPILNALISNNNLIENLELDAFTHSNQEDIKPFFNHLKIGGFPYFNKLHLCDLGFSQPETIDQFKDLLLGGGGKLINVKNMKLCISDGYDQDALFSKLFFDVIMKAIFLGYLPNFQDIESFTGDFKLSHNDYYKFLQAVDAGLLSHLRGIDFILLSESDVKVFGVERVGDRLVSSFKDSTSFLMLKLFDLIRAGKLKKLRRIVIDARYDPNILDLFFQISIFSKNLPNLKNLNVLCSNATKPLIQITLERINKCLQKNLRRSLLYKIKIELTP